MPDQITGERQITGQRLTSLFRPRSVALVGASDKSTFSMLAYRNLVEFGFDAHTYLVNRRGTQTHGRPTVTSCAQIGEPVDVAYLMVPQVVGSFQRIRPAAEITRQIVADCEQRIADLARTLPGAAS